MGVVALCAGIGVAAAFVRRGDWRFRLTSISLATAAILAPANQARIHTIVSLFKHVGFGAWFAASVGGYALSSLTAAVPAAKVLLAVRVSAAVAVATGVVGSLLATSHYHAWPNARSFTGALGPILRDTPGPIVASEETYVISYYLSDASARHVFADPGYFSYTDPYTHARLHGNSAYADAIENRYFGIIALPFDADMQADDAIRSDIDLYGGYVLVATIPYTANGLSSAYRIWVREG